jgi:hypothetical protein
VVIFTAARVPQINVSSTVTINATLRPIDVERAGPDDLLRVTSADNPIERNLHRLAVKWCFCSTDCVKLAKQPGNLRAWLP